MNADEQRVVHFVLSNKKLSEENVHALLGGSGARGYFDVSFEPLHEDSLLVHAEIDGSLAFEKIIVFQRRTWIGLFLVGRAPIHCGALHTTSMQRTGQMSRHFLPSRHI